MTISGIVSTLMSFNFVPSALMSSSRSALVLRSSLRMRSFSSWKRSMASRALPARGWLRCRRVAHVCSLLSCSSVCCSCVSSCCSVERKRASALRRSSSTRSNGREYAARPRMLMRSSLPLRLSSAFHTSSPLLANGCAMVWPKKLRCCTHMKSDSRSESAIDHDVQRLRGCLQRIRRRGDTLRAGHREMRSRHRPRRARRRSSSPVGLKPSRNERRVAHHANALRRQQSRLRAGA